MSLLSDRKHFFRLRVMLDVEWRIDQLKKLKRAVLAHEREISEALAADLGRSKTEAYFCDVGIIGLEINETLHGIRRWARRMTRHTSLAL